MFRTIVSIFAGLMIVGQANAEIVQPVINIADLQQVVMDEAESQGLDWKVNDKADYNLAIGTFIKGTNKTFVREEVHEGFWVEQNLDLGFAGKQKMEILFDKNTGQVLQLLVNGQKQEIPEPNIEIEEMTESNVTVPAGSFECIYARIKDLDKNQTSEVWINPSIVPMGGALKQKAPSQFGEVVMELTSFTKN